MEPSTYSTALNEYKSEDTNGQLRLIYAYFGLAIYWCQCLEETFTIMLWTDTVFKRRVKTTEEVNEIIDGFENSKKTMGNLLSEVKRSYGISQEIIHHLETILKSRNYLIHKFFKLEIHKTYSNTGRQEMIKFCCDFVDHTKSIDNQLRACYKKYTDKLGLNDEKINEMVDQMKIQEQKRDTI